MKTTVELITPQMAEKYLSMNLINRPPEYRTCEHCGKLYGWSRIGVPPKFCGNNCKSAARRKSGVDNVPRSCAFCGGIFMADKYGKIKFCSRSCSRRNQNRVRAED